MSILTDAIMTDLNAVRLDQPIGLYGHVSRYDGQIIECDGFPANIGSICEVETDGEMPAMAEVIGFNNGNNLLSIYDYGARVLVGARVSLIDDGAQIPVGDGLLGRVTDALGMPLDDRPRSPIIPTTTTSASVKRLIMPSKTDLPTPEPAIIPTRCP